LPFTSSEDFARRVDAIKRLIEMIKSREVVWAHVALLQYFIEGEPYSASALTVTPNDTPNLDETGDGFQCDAFFPDKILSPHALAVGQKVMSGAGGFIRVRLEVKTEDVVAIIVRTESGPQSTLYALR
jgi:hypothetical protein